MTVRQKLLGVAAVVVGGALLIAFLTSRSGEALSVESALSETRGQGFDAVIWHPTPAMRQSAEELAKSTGREVAHFAGEGQVILLRGRQITDVKQPVMIVWFPSSDDAAARVEADRPLFEGRLSKDEQAGLPNDFDVRQLSEVRVCNLVLISYDDGSDGALPARFSGLVEATESRCS